MPFCSWALDKNEDGVYQIGSAQDLVDFAAIVNDAAKANPASKTSINAVLTADIDMEGVEFDPICRHIDNDGTWNTYGYGGVFDGQGHEISNLSINTNCEAGLFGRTRDGEVRNLGIRNAKVITSNSRAAVLAGGCYSQINNCYVVGNISVMSSMEKGVIGGQIRFYNATNCYTTEPALTTNLHSTSKLVNCYCGEEVHDMAATGELCYRLNSGKSTDCIYYQTLGEDETPVLDSTHGTVYAAGAFNCDGSSKGEVTYNNESETATRDEHQFEGGKCSVCGEYNFVDGWFLIGSPADLCTFSTMVNDAAKANPGSKTNINARLTADIDMTGIAFEPICRHIDNTDPWNTYGYGGVFDGQGHEISNLTIDTDCEAGLFGRVRDGEVRNLGIRNASITTTNLRAGVLAGGCYSKINNCYVVGEIYVDAANDRGVIGGQIRFYDAVNCYTTEDALTNSLHATSKLVNCYCGDEARSMAATGELCYKLNGQTSENPVWFQTLGSDGSPVLDSTHGTVYAAGYFNCDGTSKGNITYNNESGESQRDDHQYENGICAVCLLYEQPQLVDGYYELGNAGHLCAFSEMVNGGKNKINARLISDIDMGSVPNFTPIARFDVDGRTDESIHCYGGVFDGQGHEISNLTVEDEGEAGLFGRFSNRAVCGNNGGVIKNLGVRDASITSLSKRAGVICGELLGNYTSAIPDMINCYAVGSINISTPAQQGGISGESAHAHMLNCYTSDSKLTGHDDGDVTVENCFHTVGFGIKGEAVAYEDLASGRLCFVMNGNDIDSPMWYQTLGEDESPVLMSDHGLVYASSQDAWADVHDEASFLAFREAYSAYKAGEYDEAVAHQPLVDALKLYYAELAKAESLEEYMQGYEKRGDYTSPIMESVAKYVEYEAEAQDISDYLKENPFAGASRDVLESYLTDEMAAGENELFPNGTYPYIMETRSLDNDQIVEEKAFMQKMFTAALAENYTAGSEITRLIRNASFEEGLEGWEETHSGKALTIGGERDVMTTVEAYDNTFTLSQTLTGLQNGVYELRVNAAFRAAEDLYNPLYAAQIGLNGNINFIMMEGEDVISKEEAEDGVGCHLTGSDADYSYVYGEMDGWVPKGPVGCSYAFKSGRYENRVTAVVEDGELTLSISNPGTGMSKDWTGFGNIRLFYLGTLEQASEAMGVALKAMKARANTILEYEPDLLWEFRKYPNMSSSLRDELLDAIGEVDAAATAEARMRMTEKMSRLFAQVYECRNAYVSAITTSYDACDMASAALDAGIISEEEYDMVNDWAYDIFEKYADGLLTVEEALDVERQLREMGIVPIMKDGVMEIASANDLRIFSLMVNRFNRKLGGNLMADIDMSSVEDFSPIGEYSDNVVGRNDFNVCSYGGVFDGQGHEIRNLSINTGFEGGLFSRCYQADIRNLGLVNISINCTDGLRAGALVGEFMESHATNVYVAGDITVTTDNAQCTGFAGEGAWNSVFTSCYTLHDTFVNVKACTLNSCFSGEMARNTAPTGELCLTLNGGNTENPVWRQDLGIDKYPILNPTHDIVIMDDGVITEIEKIENGRLKIENEDVYDLFGRKVSKSSIINLQPSIYIINGKKVLIR